MADNQVEALAELVREFRRGLLDGGFRHRACGELEKDGQWVVTAYAHWEFYVALWYRAPDGVRSPRQTVRVYRPEDQGMLGELAGALVAGDAPTIQDLMVRYECRTAAA